MGVDDPERPLARGSTTYQNGPLTLLYVDGVGRQYFPVQNAYCYEWLTAALQLTT